MTAKRFSLSIFVRFVDSVEMNVNQFFLLRFVVYYRQFVSIEILYRFVYETKGAIKMRRLQFFCRLQTHIHK